MQLVDFALGWRELHYHRIVIFRMLGKDIGQLAAKDPSKGELQN